MNDATAIKLSRNAARNDGLPPGAPRSEAPSRGSLDWRVLDLRTLWSAVYRNRYIAIAAMVVCILLGVAITFLSTPIFQATARIQVDTQSAQILEGADVESATAMQDTGLFLETQVDIIESRSLARAVAEQLGLFRNAPAFLERMNETPAAAPEGSFNLQQTQREQVLDALQSNLSVDLPVDSTVMAIAFSSPDPVLSAQIANAFADSYIVGNLERKYDTSSYARQFLQGELADTRQRLEESERALIGYARRAQLIDASAGEDGDQSGPRSLTTSSLVQLNRSHATAMAERINAEERWREASGTALMSLPVVLQNPAIQGLVRDRAELQAQYDENAGRYGPDFPSQMEIQAQINGLNQAIERLAGSLRDGIRQEYIVTRRQEEALEQRLGGLKDATLAEQDRSVRYNILRREVDTNRALYDGLLQRYKEISATAGIAANNVSVIDRADPPIRVVSPRPILNLALSIIAGMLAVAGIVFLREHFDDAIRSTDDVERKLGISAIGLIPRMKPDVEVQEEMSDPKSDISEAYAALRSSLMLATPTGVPRSMMFTSSGPAEGKSTSANAVAHGFAQIGRRVILIDADMRRPAQHKRFGIPNSSGLSSVLASQATIDEVILETPQANLSLVTAGPVPINPAELIAGPAMRALIDQLEAIYDVVVIDAPPVLGLADAPALASDVSNTIFVVEANGVHGRRANEALRRLQAGNANVLGVLLTKFDAKAIGYGSAEYGYVYNYGEPARPA